MKEYIEREVAVSELMPIYKSASLRNRHVFSTARKCLESIEAIPAADVVEVRHGRWIKDEETWDCYCSVCGQGAGWPWYNYCCDCGARMDGGVNDEID